MSYPPVNPPPPLSHFRIPSSPYQTTHSSHSRFRSFSSITIRTRGSFRLFTSRWLWKKRLFTRGFGRGLSLKSFGWVGLRRRWASRGSLGRGFWNAIMAIAFRRHFGTNALRWGWSFRSKTCFWWTPAPSRTWFPHFRLWGNMFASFICAKPSFNQFFSFQFWAPFRRSLHQSSFCVRLSFSLLKRIIS